MTMGRKAAGLQFETDASSQGRPTAFAHYTGHDREVPALGTAFKFPARRHYAAQAHCGNVGRTGSVKPVALLVRFLAARDLDCHVHNARYRAQGPRATAIACS